MSERDCCNEMGCRRKKPIKLMRSELSGTWYFVTDYTHAKHGEDTWRATTKHEVDPAQARQLEAMRDALRNAVSADVLATQEGQP